MSYRCYISELAEKEKFVNVDNIMFSYNTTHVTLKNMTKITRIHTQQAHEHLFDRIAEATHRFMVIFDDQIAS